MLEVSGDGVVLADCLVFKAPARVANTFKTLSAPPVPVPESIVSSPRGYYAGVNIEYAALIVQTCMGKGLVAMVYKPVSWFIKPASWYIKTASWFIKPISWFINIDMIYKSASWFIKTASWFIKPASWFIKTASAWFINIDMIYKSASWFIITASWFIKPTSWFINIDMVYKPTS